MHAYTRPLGTETPLESLIEWGVERLCLIESFDAASDPCEFERTPDKDTGSHFILALSSAGIPLKEEWFKEAEIKLFKRKWKKYKDDE